MMRIKIRGRYWHLVDSDLEHGGECDPPQKKRREICMPRHAETENDLRVQLHEMLHACCWDLDEDAVDEMSTDMARALWRLDWRPE